MQAPECKFRLPNGHKCRCVATRNQTFCRHHGAEPAPHPARDARRTNWRDLTASLPTTQTSALPYLVYVYVLLEALLYDDDRGVSDRYAGRTLRNVLRRYGSVPATLPNDPDTPALAPEPASITASAPGLRPVPQPSRDFAESFPELAALLQQANLSAAVPKGRR